LLCCEPRIGESPAHRYTERGSQWHFEFSATNHDLLSPYRTTPFEPWVKLCIATNGVCYGNMEGLNDLRSASGKGWIGIGRSGRARPLGATVCAALERGTTARSEEHS